jgi:hypothetical protein
MLLRGCTIGLAAARQEVALRTIPKYNAREVAVKLRREKIVEGYRNVIHSFGLGIHVLVFWAVIIAALLVFDRRTWAWHHIPSGKTWPAGLSGAGEV